MNKKNMIIICIGILLCVINMQTPEHIDESISSSSLTQEEFEQIEQSTQRALSADIVSIEILRKTIQSSLLIEQNGTTAQQRAGRMLISNNRARFIKHISTAVDTLLFDREVQDIIKRITLAAVTGALPYLLLTGLKMSTGQISSTDIGVAEDAAIYGALLQMISELTKLIPGGEPKDVVLAKGAELLKGEASWWSVPMAGGLSFMTKEVGSMVVESIERKGGAKAIIRQIDWKNVILGEEASSQISQAYAAPVDYLIDQFKFIIKSKKTRDIVGTVILTAAENALIGFLLWHLGVWFIAEETLSLAMQNAAIRGTIQGFINYFASQKAAPGVLQNVSSGFMSRYIQKTLLLQQPELSFIDATPVILKEITITSIQSTVNQFGGWKKTIDTVTQEAKVSAGSRWGWMGRLVKEKVDNTINWIQKDLNRGFKGGVL